MGWVEVPTDIYHDISSNSNHDIGRHIFRDIDGGIGGSEHRYSGRHIYPDIGSIIKHDIDGSMSSG